MGQIRRSTEAMQSSGSRGCLIIVCGLPGAGKTTHARQLETELGAVRFCPDEWMQALSIDIWDERRREELERLQWRLARQLLACGMTVIVEWGSWGRTERDALRRQACELGATVELHYLSAPVHVLFERLQRRGLENPPITREQLSQWAAAFQAPSEQELALFDNAVALQTNADGLPDSTDDS
jgi:predicted kinase